MIQCEIVRLCVITMTVSLPLAAGANTIQLANPVAFAPDFDRIAVAVAPS